ncbi:hypothetical protein L3Q82_010159 [Scortum barcoo]|uniref:Uncharacterized protein n=1 Tax=Scortum barcoo TaxID=214431 RepID=A0ACB8WD16_9TELE|nr:hypothetical protein L3Q82_010159 [Scortum barcoo]
MAPQVTDRPRGLALTPSPASTVILYLLLPVLILGFVESQIANVTKGDFGKRNETFRESSDNSTLKPANVSGLHVNKSWIEDELQKNDTSGVITEDEENFQERENELAARLCHRDVLVKYSDAFCGEKFHLEMTLISRDKWCVLENIIRPYNDMTLCLEKLSNMVGCYYPNRDVQDVFLHVHSFYFQNCSQEAKLVDDAPQGLVIALTLIPVSIIPILVYLVVWKNCAVLSFVSTEVRALCLCLSDNTESDSRPEWKNLLFDYQNISDSYLALTKVNNDLRRDNEILKEHSAWLHEQAELLNRTSAKLMSVNLALSFESTELMEQIVNLTSTNLQLTQEHERLVQQSSEQEEKKMNMSETIKHLVESNALQEEEGQRLSEVNDFLRDELLQVREKNQELLKINDKFQEEVKNLSKKIEALLNDHDEASRHNVQLQERLMELQEQNQILNTTLEDERQEAAEREETRRDKMDQMMMDFNSTKEAYRSLHLYCPVVNHKTKERLCTKCPDGWRLFENKCYYFSSRTLTWSSSRAWCQTQGGDLLIINTEPEQSFIFESSLALQQDGTRLWIGMTDAQQEGDWLWVDGSPVTSDNQYWLSRPGLGTEPDDWRLDDPLGEDCGHIDTHENALKSWMDGSCKLSYRWICEKNL